MKFLVANSDNGGFKQISCVKGTDTLKKDATQPKLITNYFADIPRLNHILAFRIVFDRYIVALRPKSVCIYDLHSDEYEQIREIELSARPLCFEELDEDLNAFFVASSTGGKIWIISFDEDKEVVEVQLEELDGLQSINSVAHNSEVPGTFAYGGTEVELKVVRLWATPEEFEQGLDAKKFDVSSVFAFKNAAKDYLGILPKVCHNRIRFLPTPEGTEPSKDHFKLVVGTTDGKLRTYNLAKKKRPTNDWYLGDKKPIITLTVVDNAESVIVTNNQNMIAKYSLTEVNPRGHKVNTATAGTIYHPVAKLHGKYLEGGNTGAVYGLQVEEGLVATGGLDRYLRVFDLESRRILAKVYMAVEVADVIILDYEDLLDDMTEAQQEEEVKKRKREETVDDEEEDALWDELEQNSKKQKHK